MTTLGSLVKPKTAAFDLDAAVRHVEQVATSLAASIGGTSLGAPSSIRAAITGWINQDDDAHEMCSLVACRTPLHPGPCKGWKGTLHAVSPHIWKQIEQERVDKANARRTKKIADLKAQGKPIPRKLLTEIKPKPAPSGGGPNAHAGHPANNATPTPLGKVNQQADLTGGQAHKASQAISQGAGIKPNTASLPKGPKGKKPTVAGRGPAFVITQPKVTDTYKLDKASKLTPQEWDSLSPADQKLIRDELEAIKQRGFGPQQTKADQLLAKLQPTATVGGSKAPAAPNTPAAKAPSTPSATPGKTTLGQAVKTPAAPSTATQGRAASVAQAKTALAITEAIHGPQTTDPQKLATALDMMKAKGDLKQQPKFRLLVDRLAQDALKQATASKMPNNPGITDFNHQIRDHIAEGKPGLPPLVQRLKDHKAGNAPAAKAPNAPAAPSTPNTGTPNAPKAPSAPSIGIPRNTGPTPQAPGAPNNTPAAFPPHVQHARAVAGRALGGRPTAKVHLDTYGKLSKADFDSLDSTTQKTIRDDLANASAKFLDPKKKQAARDLLDRFGSRHPADGGSKSTNPSAPNVTPASPAPSNAPAAHPKGYSDPQVQAVKAASSGTADTGDVLKAVARLSPKQVNDLDDADKRAITGRLAFIATHPKATDVQKKQAAAYGRIIVGGSPVQKQPADHTVSIGEIDRIEQTTGLAAKQAALDATDVKKAMAAGTPEDRVKALAGLTKAQLDALPADERRKILDTLVSIHDTGGSANLEKAAEEAVEKYTGVHPAIHRMKTAEQDFRDGKIDGDQVYSEFVSAIASTPSSRNAKARADLEAEGARIARDNPTLPTYARVKLVGDAKYGMSTYNAISFAGMRHYWDAAPRMSRYDMNYLFDPTDADLANIDPIHAQAIRDLRNQVLLSGLRGQPGQPGGSPWSTSTRQEAARAYLGIGYGKAEIPADRLKRFQDAPPGVQMLVRSTVRKDMEGRTDPYSKTEAWIALRELEGKPPLAGTERDAVLAAADRVASPQTKLDAYRRLDPADFRKLPDFTREAITTDLDGAQRRIEGFGPVENWGPTSNSLKMFPAALKGHLDGTRLSANMSRDDRAVHDIALYGTKIITPADRVAAYNKLTPTQINALPNSSGLEALIDLKKIEDDTSLPTQTRYDAAMNGQIFLRTNSQITLNSAQISAAQAADLHPNSRYNDVATFASFSNLNKADYDSMSPALRTAIDLRAAQLPGSDQQVLNGIWHPQAPAAANPSGMTPTTGNVPPHVQEALDTIYGTHPKAHTMAHQLKTYGGLRGSDFGAFNPQEQQQLLSDLSFIATTAKGPSADKAKKLIDRFTPPGTPSGQLPGSPAIIPPANAVPGQTRYATPLKGLKKAANSGRSGDGWLTLPGGKRVWGHYGAAGLLIKHTDPNSGEERYLMVQRGPAISDPGKWTFPGGASDSLETPHEGATRETIEELGLKDDQFKDALVHGDHVFSVPGSTWKYTTVAASVPTMFKPDLSSHHARMETSDAKWMTLDEIRALDKSGKLHGPIANGLLEKNVISLYPSTGVNPGTKLGQIARPGPVTKRPNRMVLPSGGRQSPASYNAWPHPHKPSKGKNLVSTKADLDAMRQKVKQERGKYDGKTADGRLAAIGAMQGYDELPTVVSKSEIDKLLATGDYIEAWRGVQGAGGGWSARGVNRAGKKTAAEINEEMRSGPAYYGKGIFGNGYYLATDRSVARQYSDKSPGSMVRILIPKSAIMKKYDQVEREAQKNSSRGSRSTGARVQGDDPYSTFWDPGRYGAALGIDGIEINPHHRAHGGGGASHVASHGRPAFNWLNRSVLIIQKEPG